MPKRFYKMLMLNRLAEEGRTEQIDEASMKMMDNLDEQPAYENCWRRVVNDEPVLWCVGKDGKGVIVNESDCK